MSKAVWEKIACPLPSTGIWEGDRHFFPIRVYWENTDAGGVVYHSQYLNFAERARSEGLRLLGLSQQAVVDDLKIAFAVAKATLDFKRPARLDDALVVETAIVNVGASLMDMEQWIRRGEDLLVHLSLRVVCVSVGDFRAVRIPASLRTMLTQFD